MNGEDFVEFLWLLVAILVSFIALVDHHLGEKLPPDPPTDQSIKTSSTSSVSFCENPSNAELNPKSKSKMMLMRGLSGPMRSPPGPFSSMDTTSRSRDPPPSDDEYDAGYSPGSSSGHNNTMNNYNTPKISRSHKSGNNYTFDSHYQRFKHDSPQNKNGDSITLHTDALTEFDSHASNDHMLELNSPHHHHNVWNGSIASKVGTPGGKTVMDAILRGDGALAKRQRTKSNDPPTANSLAAALGVPIMVTTFPEPSEPVSRKTPGKTAALTSQDWYKDGGHANPTIPQSKLAYNSLAAALGVDVAIQDFEPPSEAVSRKTAGVGIENTMTDWYKDGHSSDIYMKPGTKIPVKEVAYNSLAAALGVQEVKIESFQEPIMPVSRKTPGARNTASDWWKDGHSSKLERSSFGVTPTTIATCRSTPAASEHTKILSVKKNKGRCPSSYTTPVKTPPTKPRGKSMADALAERMSKSSGGLHRNSRKGKLGSSAQGQGSYAAKKTVGRKERTEPDKKEGQPHSPPSVPRVATATQPPTTYQPITTASTNEEPSNAILAELRSMMMQMSSELAMTRGDVRALQEHVEHLDNRVTKIEEFKPWLMDKLNDLEQL